MAFKLVVWLYFVFCGVEISGVFVPHVCSISIVVSLYLVFCSGSRSGTIHHHDVRVPQHHVATLAGHTQEVCGLKWSPDGKYLASGGNDNLLNIWDSASNQPSNTESGALYTFSQHQAAVKVSGHT